MGKGYGDRLVRGGAKASFPASEVGISSEKFEDAVKDFDPAGFLARAEAEEEVARIRRAERLVAEEAEALQLDKEREARHKLEAEAEQDVEPQPEFSSRYPDSKETGVSGSNS